MRAGCLPGVLGASARLGYDTLLFAALMQAAACRARDASAAMPTA